MTPTNLDRVKTYLARVVDGIMRRVDWMAWYPARVLSQNADGTLELRPDNARVPGLSKVPIRLGLPGVTVKVTAGARVLVGFENGDPSRPVASVWEASGAQLTEIAIGNTPTSYLALATQTKAALDAIVTWANSHTHIASGPGAPTATGVPPLSTSTNVASTTIKST